MGTRRTRHVLAVVVMGLPLAGPAMAQEAEPEEVHIQEWGDGDLAQSERSAAHARRPDRVGSFLVEEARNGRLHDSSAVRELTVTDDAGREYTLVYGADSRPEELEVAVSQFDDGVETRIEFGSVFSEVGQDEATTAGGFGYGAGFNPSGMTFGAELAVQGPAALEGGLDREELVVLRHLLKTFEPGRLPSVGAELSGLAPRQAPVPRPCQHRRHRPARVDIGQQGSGVTGGDATDLLDPHLQRQPRRRDGQIPQ